MSGQGERRQRRPAVPLLEWVGAGLGAAAAATLIGFLAFEAATRSDAPPSLAVYVVAERLTGDGRAVDVRVRNDGGLTAAEVTVVGSAAGDDAAASEVTLVFDFVPRGSSRDGTLMLPPGGGPVALRVTGWRDP